MDEIITTEGGFRVKYGKFDEYDPGIDYQNVLVEFNRLIDSGKTDEAKELLRRNGGLIAIYRKREEQRNINYKYLK